MSMRVLAALGLAIALSVPSAIAQEERDHQVGTVSISLSVAFVANPRAFSDDSVSVTLVMFQNLESRQMVVVQSLTGMTEAKRIEYQQGTGVEGSAPFTYSRIPLSSLPLSESVAQAAGVAFLLVRDGEVAVHVQGCKGEVCFSLIAGGPAGDDEVPESAYASLLTGATLMP